MLTHPSLLLFAALCLHTGFTEVRGRRCPRPDGGKAGGREGVARGAPHAGNTGEGPPLNALGIRRHGACALLAMQDNKHTTLLHVPCSPRPFSAVMFAIGVSSATYPGFSCGSAWGFPPSARAVLGHHPEGRAVKRAQGGRARLVVLASQQRHGAVDRAEVSVVVVVRAVEAAYECPEGILWVSHCMALSLPKLLGEVDVHPSACERRIFLRTPPPLSLFLSPRYSSFSCHLRPSDVAARPRMFSVDQLGLIPSPPGTPT